MAKNTYLVVGVAALTAGAVMLLSRRAAAALPNGPVPSPTPSPAPVPPPSAALPPPIYLPAPRPAPTPTPAPADICTFLSNPQNSQVFFAQVKLYRMSYLNTAADGRLNPDTVTALRVFQQAGGWPVTGALDAQTLAGINSDFSDRSRGVEGTLPLRPYPYTLPSC